MRIAGLSPFGLGYQKPHHYWEMFKVVWENRDNLPYAWRVLNHGVCDGCSLGPRGLRDDTLEGTHLCLTRMRLLRLNTMPAIRAELFDDVAALKKRSSTELRKLGRLPFPMLRKPGEKGFTRVTWETALAAIAERLKPADRQRVAFFTTSRGLTNEVYYVAAKLARLYGTNHIDNAARLCHAASSVALKETLGVGASTVSNKDWLNCELIVLMGTNLANNQPVAMKYLHEAKRNGARIVVVNPYREPGLERYWIPSLPMSALFGTRFRDEFFQVRPGGDVAFSNGVLKCLIEMNALDHSFIDQHTQRWPAVKQMIESQTWPELEANSGLPRAEMQRFATMYAGVKSAIFIWSMGLTQHPHGVDNVKSVVNLAMARGMLGKPNCGVVPIRGHSGVQGGAECGSVPNQFPGGAPINEESARVFAERWGVAEVPSWHGMHCGAMLDAAAAGDLDALYAIGGNFLETMPDPARMSEALRRVPLRVHQDILLNSSMLEDAGELTVLLPAQTRYEQEGGGTQTSTERRLRYTPEIPGHRIGEARSEWRILVDLGKAMGIDLKLESADAIREEMDRVMPMYRGIAQLKAEGDSFQYGGRLLCSAPDFVGQFSPLTLPVSRGDGKLFVATRRGTQFNSMILKERDALTGCSRDEIIVSAADARQHQLEEGDSVELTSALGRMTARIKLGDVRPGSIQAHWPEANDLIHRQYDPKSGEPDYNAEVTLKKL